MPTVPEKLTDPEWFVEFNNENKGEEEPNEGDSKTEGETVRERGRPKKTAQNNLNDKGARSSKNDTIVDTSFADFLIDTDSKESTIFVCEGECDTDKGHKQDEMYHALICNINSDPANYKEAMVSIDKTEWKKAIYEELNSMYRNKVWKVIDRPTTTSSGSKVCRIDTRWIFKRKINAENQIKFKARLVVRGFLDKNFYELRETYAPVSRLPLVRLVLAIANKYNYELCQLDVKTAFLNGVLDEEIYMEIPEGTNYSEKVRREKVCKLERALYGLRVSPKRWYDRFTEEVLKLDLKNSELEPCLFIWQQGAYILLLLLYVDDILIVTNDKSKLGEVIDKLGQSFEMTLLGEQKEFLGICIERDRKNKTRKLHQERYTEKVLKRFGSHDSHPKCTPMATSQVLNRERKLRKIDANDESRKETHEPENVPYREAVGSLLYLSGVTRPDIAYAVNILSRHQIDSKESDWSMVKRVFRYLKGTINVGLIYRGEFNSMTGYADASFADCKNSLTTCGFLIKLFDDTVHWRTHKQTYVSLATRDAEYVAMCDATKEILSIYNSLRLIITNHKNLLPIKLWCDNQAAIATAETEGGNKIRHMIEIKEHFVKQWIAKGVINLGWVRSREQLADIFTKPLARDLHYELMNKILNINK